MGKGVPAILLNLGFEVDTCCMEVSAFVKPHALHLCPLSSQHHLCFLVSVQREVGALCHWLRQYVMVTTFYQYELFFQKFVFL